MIGWFRFGRLGIIVRIFARFEMDVDIGVLQFALGLLCGTVLLYLVAKPY